MPVRPVSESDDVARQPFAEPEGAAPLTTTRVEPGRHRWDVCRDLVTQQSALDIVKDNGTVRHHHADLDVSRSAHETYTSTAGDFESSQARTWVVAFARGDWQARTVTHTALTCSATEFIVEARLDAYVGATRLASRSWHEVIPRRLL